MIKSEVFLEFSYYQNIILNFLSCLKCIKLSAHFSWQGNLSANFWQEDFWKETQIRIIRTRVNNNWWISQRKILMWRFRFGIVSLRSLLKHLPKQLKMIRNDHCSILWRTGTKLNYPNSLNKRWVWKHNKGWLEYFRFISILFSSYKMGCLFGTRRPKYLSIHYLCDFLPPKWNPQGLLVQLIQFLLHNS